MEFKHIRPGILIISITSCFTVHTSLLLYLRKHLAAAGNGSVLTEQVTVLKDVVNRVRRDPGIMVGWHGQLYKIAKLLPLTALEKYFPNRHIINVSQSIAGAGIIVR